MLPPSYWVLENGTILGKSGKPRKFRPDKHGYLTLDIKDRKKRLAFLVHQLVCTQFHGPKPFPEAQVRHLDGNKLNNRADNLCWGTAAENQADRKRHGTDGSGERSPRAKLKWDQVRDIRARYAAGGVTQKALAVEYGVSHYTVGQVVRHETWLP